MGDFNVAIRNIKIILEAMQTDEFIERGSECRRGKRQGTTDCEPRTNYFHFLAL